MGANGCRPFHLHFINTLTVSYRNAFALYIIDNEYMHKPSQNESMKMLPASSTSHYFITEFPPQPSVDESTWSPCNLVPWVPSILDNCIEQLRNVIKWMAWEMSSGSLLIVGLCTFNARPCTDFDFVITRKEASNKSLTVLTVPWCLGIILCMCSANERRRYIVTSSLISWAHT